MALPTASRPHLPATLAALALWLFPSAAVAASGAALGADDFVNWTVEGEDDAHFAFQTADGSAAGELVGRPSNKEMKNSFLCSPRAYADLRVSFEFRIEPASLNSGLQFRSRVLEDGRVAGPQLELDLDEEIAGTLLRRTLIPAVAFVMRSPWRPRDWPTAGIYDESGDRGWIYPGDAGGDARAFAAQGKRLSRVDGWNRVVLEATGARVRTWLNGEPRADYSDATSSDAGRVCFQVHGGSYDDPSAFAVRWRDIRIEDLAARRGPIHHTVFFDLNSAPGSEQERAFFEAAAGLAAIPGVENLRRVEEVSTKNAFRYGLTMRFADQTAYDVYDAHPAHEAFVRDVWIPNVADFQEIDFVDP